MRFKKLCLFIFSIIYLSVIFSVSVYAESFYLHCNTAPELLEEATNTLIQKKITELNKNYSPWSEEIALFSDFNGTMAGGITMPSTGDVHALVIPLKFSGYEIPEGRTELIQDKFFGIHKQADKSLFFTYKDERSASELFKVHSNGKLNFTGDVMPLYEISELPSYYTQNDPALSKLLSEILSYYKKEGIIDDYSKYDADNDGYIDCLAVVYPYHSNLKYTIDGTANNTWKNHVVGGSGITVDGDNIKVNTRITMDYYPDDSIVSNSPLSTQTILHECGHLMGLPDNYPAYSFAEYSLLTGTADMMASGGGPEKCYYNSYYRYLLDWIEPKILPYDDNLEKITLCSYENENSTGKERAIIVIPDLTQLPFSEFYIAEYYTGLHIQNKSITDKHSGIMLWHINGDYKSGGAGFLNKTNFIKPVYKNGGTYNSYNEFMYDIPNDLYITNDVWSSETTPSSNFYDDVYTGAYMKVLSMDDEKATIQAGFKNPDLSPAPGISISPPSKKAVKSGEKQVEFTVMYENADTIGDLKQWSLGGGEYMYRYDIVDYIQLETTGTAQASRSCKSYKEPGADEYKCPAYVQDIKGEGTIKVTIKERSAWSTGSLGGRKYAPAVTSEVIYVDNTPPEITLNGNGEITLDYGEEYEELGAKVTDNLDPDIENKLKISGTVDTNKAGAYTVTYDATDHAENKAAQVVRTVTVLAPPPSPTPTVKPTASPSPTPTAKPTAKPTATPSPTPTVKPTASPSPTPTAKPTASPSPTPTAKPTASPNPTPTAKPTASPSPTPTAKPTATPSPTPTPTATQSPSSTVETTDRIEFERWEDSAILAKIIFEKTTPPKSEDILLYIAYYRDNRLIKLEIPTITEMTAMFKIDEALQDCEIKAYVWDKEMKPFMEVQKNE